MVPPMPCYSISIRSADGRDHEDTGRVSLHDDDEARTFGTAMIRDVMRGHGEYSGWTMSVADGERAVCNINFDSHSDAI